MSSNPFLRRAGALALLLVLAAGCGRSSSAEPPLVMLEPDQGGSSVVPSSASPPSPPVPAASTDGEVCAFALDPEVSGDLSRWPEYRDVLDEALPPEVDVDEVLTLLAEPRSVLTPRRIAALDDVWTVLDERCGATPHRVRCRSLMFYMLADPLARAANGEDRAELEAAFDLAVEKLEVLVGALAAEPQVADAVEAHLRVVRAARESMAAAGWRPEGLNALEPMAEEMMALGDPSVTEPLGFLEGGCGLY